MRQPRASSLAARAPHAALRPAATLALSVSLLACSNLEDPGKTVEYTCPTPGLPNATSAEEFYRDFRPVSVLLEARCGTLDCHGQPGRPLRIYGQNGLRSPNIPEDVDPTLYYSGTNEVPTTFIELEENLRSMCALEPELMQDVLLGEADVEDLTLIRKPKLIEKHKGGIIWETGKAGDRCLQAFIIGDHEPGLFEPGDCEAELEGL